MRRGLIDRKGQMAITFTPLTEAWMHEELILKADGKKIDLFEVDIRDNLFDISGNPILSEDAVQEFEDSLPDDIRESRARGKFFHLRGRVYREFGDEHCLSDMLYGYPDPVVAVLDPHDRQPHHVIWAYVDRQDDVYIDDELIVRCELPELSAHVKLKEKKRGYNIKKRLIDPNFGRKPAKPGVKTTVIQELRVNGTNFYEANDDIELGHMVTREMLHWNSRKPMTATNKPKLFISRDRCPVTIRSLKNYQFEEWKGKTKDERDPKESPRDKETHGADCVRYLTTSKPTYRALSGRRDSGELEEAPY
jgi:hypothetical protein